MARTVQELKYRLVADEQNLVKGLKKAGDRTKAFGQQLDRTGKLLSTRVSLPIAAVGAGLIKLAADAEETTSKFNAVFKDQSESVSDWADQFAADVGRSATEQLGFLATIQDTFVPLGFAREEAAELSKSVVELSTDLSSFNNLPTEQVIRDIQSALVGNTETLRKYGVVANQAAIVQEAVNLGLIEQGQELDAAAKAQAIYSLTVQGTTDAQGDAVRTAGSATNQFRALKSEATELGIELGQQLLPIAVDLVQTLRNGVAVFSDLDSETQKSFISLGLVAAAAGPLLVITGKTITAVRTLKTAMVALRVAGLGPIGVAAAAVVAGVAAMVGIFGKLQDHLATRTEKELADRYGDLKDSVNLTTDELNTLDTQLDNLANSGLPLEDTADLLAGIVGDYGLSVDEARDLLNQHEGINDELVNAVVLERQRREESQKTLGQTFGLQESWEDIREQTQANLETAREEAELRRQEAEATRREAEIEEARQRRRQEAADARQAALQQFNTSREIAEAEYESGLITQNELQQQINDAKRQEIDALIQAGFRIDQQSIGAARLRSLIEDVKNFSGDIGNNFRDINTESQSIGAKIEQWKKTTADTSLSAEELEGIFGTVAESAQVAAGFLESVTDVTADPNLVNVFEAIENNVANVQSLLTQIELDQASKILGAVGKIVNLFKVGLSIISDYSEESERVAEDIEEISVRTQNNIFRNTQERLRQEFEAEIDKINKTEKRRLESINETENERLEAVRRTLSEELQRELEQLGILETSREQAYDNLYARALEQNEDLTEAEKDRIREALDAQLEADRERERNEEDAREKRRKAEEDFRKAEAEFKKEQFEFEQQLAIQKAEIELQTAIAELGVGNREEKLRLEAAYANLIRSIRDQPPPPIPTFATGGSFTVPPGFAGDSFPIPAAMAQSGERVTVETVEQQAVSGAAGAQMMQIVLTLDGREIAQTVTEYQNDGIVRLELN